MKRFLINRDGGALAMVLIVMAVLTILGVSVLRIAVAETNFTAHNENKIQAYYIARSGAQAVAEYMLNDANNDAEDLVGKTSEWNAQLDGGKFQVTVTKKTSGIIDIVSVGEYKDIQQDAKINLYGTEGSIFDHALVAYKIITQPSGSGQGVVINGSIITKEEKPTLNESKVVVTEGPVNPDPVPSLVFPPIVLPDLDNDGILGEDSDDYHDDLGVINLKNKPNVVLQGTPSTLDGDGNLIVTPTYIKMDSIFLQNTILEVKDGPVHLYVFGDVDMNTNSQFNVHSGGKLYIYVVDPAKEFVVDFQGKGDMNSVFIYAPDSEIIWNNAQAADFTGALIGRTVEIFNKLTITYDDDIADGVNLDTDSSGLNFTGYIWVD